MTQRIRISIKRKPPPPPLDPFTCAICARETRRDPYSPEWQRPPVCNECCVRSSRRQGLWGVPFELWHGFQAGHALITAINQEAKRARASR